MHSVDDPQWQETGQASVHPLPPSRKAWLSWATASWSMGTHVTHVTCASEQRAHGTRSRLYNHAGTIRLSLHPEIGDWAN
jgi:hypothetical protein